MTCSSSRKVFQQRWARRNVCHLQARPKPETAHEKLLAPRVAFARFHHWFRGKWGFAFPFCSVQDYSSPAPRTNRSRESPVLPRRHIGKREDPGDEVVGWLAVGGWRLAVGGRWRLILAAIIYLNSVLHCRDKEVKNNVTKIWLGKYKYFLLLLLNIKEELSYNLTTTWTKWTS